MARAEQEKKRVHTIVYCVTDVVIRKMLYFHIWRIYSLNDNNNDNDDDDDDEIYPSLCLLLLI